MGATSERKTRPYPYERLARVRREDVARTRALVRSLAPAGAFRPVRDVLGPRWLAVFGEPVELWPAVPTLERASTLEARWASVASACSAMFTHGTLGVCAAVIDGGFALRTAARALRVEGPAPRMPERAERLTALYEGALSLVCARAAALASAPGPAPELRAVTDAFGDVLAAMGSPRELVCWPFRVRVGLDVGEVTLVCGPEALLRAPLVAQPEGSLFRDGALDECAIEFLLIAARSTLDASELRALEPGDVLASEGALASDPAVVYGVSGPMVLALGACELDVSVRDGGVTIAGEARRRDEGFFAETHAKRKGTGMSEGGGDPAVRTELLTSLAVTVEVVMASGTVSLGEVNAWRVGEVIALPARLGSAVLVRAGGRAVARGELVDVEGDVGVRVTELL